MHRRVIPKETFILRSVVSQKPSRQTIPNCFLVSEVEGGGRNGFLREGGGHRGEEISKRQFFQQPIVELDATEGLQHSTR